MPLLSPYQGPLIRLRLSRDLGRTLKRGHPWVYAEALRQRPAAAAGAHAILIHKNQDRTLARGYYDPHSPLAFRVCTVDQDELLNDAWAVKRMDRALRLRQALFDEQTTGFRLFNGEGDGLPGLICDVYGHSAVIQLDGPGAKGFWHQQGIAQWLAESLPLELVYLREQARYGGKGQLLKGDMPTGPIPFRENGVQFTADIVYGQKTGFFLDQRENRLHIKQLAANRRILNLFGYTGGFAVYAGLGGARQVTSVDVAAPALEVASEHWRLNGLAAANHYSVQNDAFDFLKQAAAAGRSWELVVVDPPSLASSRKTIGKAVTAYERLIAAAARVTAPDGILAAASCSSHVDLATFLATGESAIAKARRRATVLRITGQPPDHPSPLPFAEFRYLKFVMMRVE